MMIYFVVRNLRYGGIQQVNARIADALMRAGLECELIVYNRGRDEFETSVPVRLLHEVSFRDSDIVFSNNGRDILHLLRQDLRFLKKVRWFHIQHTELNPEVTNPFLRLFQAILFRHFVMRAERTIFVGEELRRAFVLRYPELENRSSTIPNPLMPRNVYIEPQFEVRRARRLLHVGRISYQKNQARMLLILSNLHKLPGFEDISLSIAGAGDITPLREQCRALGLEKHVAFLGHRSDIIDLMLSHDAICLTSRWEGLPTVLVEALFHAPRVFAIRCPYGVSELVRAAQGTLVEDGPDANIASALANCLNDTPVPVSQRTTKPYFYEGATRAYQAIIDATGTHSKT